MNQARRVLQPSLKPGDSVPESGIYRAGHSADCPSRSFEMILMESQRFPNCRLCGSRVRFSLAHAAPHILADSDFKANS